MPYVAGESLRDRLTREKQLPVDDAIKLVQEVALALDYAHRQGVIHRDIKPENILLAEGHALVADFGIARAIGSGDQSITGTGIAIGTPAYMSPEQASGTRDVDARTDVYALGCVLFEVLAGEPPFTGPTPQAILARALTERCRPIHPIRPAVPEALDAVIAKATAATAADRFEGAAQFARALERRVDSEATTGRSSVARAVARRPVFAALALGVLLGAGALFAWRRSHGGVEETARPGLDPEATVDPRHVVAVLPFRDLSADSSQEYLAAGISEEINAQVSRIGALRVLSRGAIIPYLTDPDRLHRLANELNVGSVIEGTTRLAGTHVRIEVSVTDARSGQMLWSDQYDRELRDALVMEEDVARQISTALQAALTPAEARRIARGGAQHPEAYQLYLRSKQLSSASPVQNRAAIELLREAVRKDSAFPEAWAILGRRYFFLAGPGNLDSGLAAADRAVALDSDVALAHWARGTMLGSLGQVGPSRLALLSALERDPNLVGAMEDLSFLEVIAGHYEESLYWALRSVPHDPNRPIPYYHVALPLILLGNDRATERWLTRAAQRFPDVARLGMELAWLDCMRGRDRETLARARQLVAAHPEDEQVRSMLMNVTFLTGASDAESVLEPLYREAPGAGGGGESFLWQSYRTLYGLLLARRGQRDSAQVLWRTALAQAEQLIRRGNDSFSPRLEIASIHAVRGDTAAALDWLDRAYQAGWHETRVIARDPFFVGLRENQRFKDIVGRAQADVDAMRRRASLAHPALFKVQ